MFQHPQWIVIADDRKAALFRCVKKATEDLHLDFMRSLSNPHEGEHEHHRPTSLGGAEKRGANRSGAHAAPHSVAQRHDVEEESLRFVREVNEWLLSANRDLGMADGHLSIFAPPKVLGQLRKHLDNMALKPEYHEGEFTRLSSEQLAAHSTIRTSLNRTTAC